MPKRDAGSIGLRSPREALLCHLRPTADPSPPTLYKYEAPIGELNRVTHKQGLAARRFGNKKVKFLQRFVSFGHRLLQ